MSRMRLCGSSNKGTLEYAWEARVNRPTPVSMATVLVCLGLATPLAAAERWSIGLTAN